MAFSVRNFDTTKALKLINKSEALSRSQGHSYSIADMQNLKGIVHNSRGEFSASVESYQECIRLHERMGAPTMSIMPHNIAWTYNEMGMGEEALEWAMMAIDTLKSHPSHLPLAYFEVARALVNLGRLKEAREYLEEAQERGLKIADEVFLQNGYIISGQLEMTEGRHLDALYSFERSFEICERTGRQNRLNSSLVKLTECELALFENNKDTQFDETSGPWMDRLERETNERNIPGIQGRMLLLKAELRLKQGRKDDAALLLSEVIKLAENPEMRYLREKANSLRSLASAL
jgi:tetratricopeptide (TPR) repeat protein